MSEDADTTGGGAAGEPGGADADTTGGRDAGEPVPRRSTARATRQLAVALADAMLAGLWHPDAMQDRPFPVLEARPAWIPALVSEVLEAYPRPPADRPRELADFVLGSGAFDRARRIPQGLPKPRRWTSAPTSTVHRPFHTPVIDHAGALAECLGIGTAELGRFADPHATARRAPSQRIAHYRYRWLDRPSGPRLLEAPKPRLAALQRRILDELLSPIPVHPAAHGFVAGRSVVTGATVHVGADTVLTFDLEHFFASIAAGRIWGVLRSAGYPEPVAYLLTGLTTHATAVSALRAMPRGADPDRAFRLQRRLADPHLPQGAPTSPQLANLVAFALDRRIAGYAKRIGATYTRYADDITLSGGAALARRRESICATVDSITRDAGFRLNPAKSRMRRQYQRQVVTGITVNAAPNLPRADVDRLRAILHDCLLNGPEAANRLGHSDFRAHLLGRISWVASVNARRGAKLRAAFDEIDWPR